MRTVWRVGVLGAAVLALALATRGGNDDTSTTAAVQASTRAVTRDTLLLVRGGIGIPLADGQVIAVAGDLEATVSLTMDPRTRYARTLHMQLTSASGPVEDATVTVAARMLTMDHGSFTARAFPSGIGTYVAELPFVMPGDWRLEVHVTSAKASGGVIIDVDEFN